MNQNQIKQAIMSALTDDATLSKIADVASKKIMDQKAKVSTLEDELVKRHVVFGVTDGDYLTASEVASKLADEFDITEEISARRLGKSLLRDAEEVKNTSSGRAYLIEAFMKDVKNHVPQEDAITDELPEDEEDTDVDEVTQSDIDRLVGRHDDLEESKKIVETALEELENKEFTPSKVVSVGRVVPNDSAELISNEFETIQKYEDHLNGLKFKKLVKHVEKYDYNVDTEELDKDEIIHDIIECLENEYGLLFETEDILDKQDLTDLKPEKKKKKKGKKDKKKKKNKDTE